MHGGGERKGKVEERDMIVEGGGKSGGEKKEGSGGGNWREEREWRSGREQRWSGRREKVGQVVPWLPL